MTKNVIENCNILPAKLPIQVEVWSRNVNNRNRFGIRNGMPTRAIILSNANSPKLNNINPPLNAMLLKW